MAHWMETLHSGDYQIPENTLICQCISADNTLSNPITRKIDEKFHIADSLKDCFPNNELVANFQKTNGFCVFLNGVYSLVVKEKATEDGKYDSLENAVKDMANCIRAQAAAYEMPKIVMPVYGSNGQSKAWIRIDDMMKKELADLPVVFEVQHVEREKMQPVAQQTKEKPGRLLLRTGYFPYTKKYAEMGYYPVNIARYMPEYIKKAVKEGTLVCGDARKIFQPSAAILNGYKNSEISEEQYTQKYIAQLNAIPDKVWKSFFHYYTKLCLEKGYKGIVLMCYEKPGDFCHRNLLANYISERFKIQGQELAVEKSKAFSSQNESANQMEQEEPDR